jgi:hypothetical protein
VAGIEALMRATLHDVFGERDRERRRAAIARTYAADVRFKDAEGVVVGHDALDAKAQRILDDAPGFVFTPDGPARVNHELGQLSWTFGPAGADPVVRGMDIALVADGRIATLYTLLLTD